uniref:HNH endonuclease n=1 Tax=Salmonella derby TaxID=28144 RepID=A0A7G8AHA1_SALDE|nr:hypothetical protein CDHFNHMB_00093 [Salmonella enterica subsp. enterica serovar Derby]
MREPRPRHTLQVIRVPSLEVQDLGLTSFDSWLDEHGYDKTNARNNRTIWAREGGWHLKRCRNLETGTDDFWFIAFDGKGGKIGTVAKLAMRQPFVLFKGLTFQKLCLPGAFRPGDHHNKMLRPGLCVVHASPQYL